MVNVVRGYNYGDAYMRMLELLRSQHRLEDVVDPDTLIRKMAAGRVDGALVSPHTLVEAAERQGLSEQISDKAGGVHPTRLPLQDSLRSHSGLTQDKRWRRTS